MKEGALCIQLSPEVMLDPSIQNYEISKYSELRDTCNILLHIKDTSDQYRPPNETDMRPVFFWCKSFENGQLNYHLSSCHEIRFDNKPSINIEQKPQIIEQFQIVQDETIKVDHETIDIKFIPRKVKFAIDWLSVGHENFECSDRKLARLKGKKPCC